MDNMHTDIEVMFLMNYLTLKHPQVLENGCKHEDITVDMFLESMCDGYEYIAQHSNEVLKRQALEGMRYLKDTAELGFIYWMFIGWKDNAPQYSETACKAFSVLALDDFGPEVDIHDMAEKLIGAYRPRHKVFEEFYRESLDNVIAAIPLTIPDKDMLAFINMGFNGLKDDVKAGSLERTTPTLH